ncbi:MAG TPA: response regulator [Polyangiaceae bacterium]
MTSAPRPEGGRPRVLVVDDAPDMRRSIARLLKANHDILEAYDGVMAVEMVEKSLATGERIDAIFLDVEMPRMNGRDALEAITKLDPGLAERTIIMSGGAWDSELGQWLARQPTDRVLWKPMTVEALRAAVARALSR